MVNKINKQFLKDSHLIKDLKLCSVRLINNSNFPWIILIPKRKKITDITELNNKDQILLRRRPEKGLLGGMIEVPSTPWRDMRWSSKETNTHSPFETKWRKNSKIVTHTFTHFRLELTVMTGSGWRAAQAGEIWQPTDALGSLALPTVMKKVLRKII